MRGVFWNSRGLRDLAKINFLRDLSLEKDLDFLPYSKQTKEIILMTC